jgi:hypothetical protein
VVAAVTAGGGALLLWSVRDSLPERIATHWGPDGAPDGFSTLAGIIGPGLGITIGLTVMLTLLGRVVRHEPTMGAVSSGTAVFLAVVLFGSAYAQRGLADASNSPLSNWVMVGALAAGTVVGILVGLLLRGRVAGVPPSEVPFEARHLTWSGRLRPSRIALVVLASAIALTLGLGIWMWAASGVWFVTLLGMLLLPALPMLKATVDVSAEGLRVSAVGIQLLRVPRERIVDATVTKVSPLGDYGGWGLRGGFDGSWGWVTAEGEALRIRRHGMRDLVFTVDAAAEAARTVNALISKAVG